ncbi:ShlB/FhaC/HecB family hemolysin secretion/activation protein [Exilibacterium tricleocarpae]|uniref:ShlB/FhaC/HecB family hemolysin secretion/activation protein n=1 Tax=Exilibacterium tricleocarpae TaxID=2591008 RepID=A0A545TZH3_9GAMM|nr:ShlB/FhaC/HecB family hemolysin secretion/activation protein [Exilibacterium tricleocarpae]TQV82620.1 ShlB/FhaC/HecB family hemolysin secretion/activation protein [Exilibacterium tricleocarpae]
MIKNKKDIRLAYLSGFTAGFIFLLANFSQSANAQNLDNLVPEKVPQMVSPPVGDSPQSLERVADFGAAEGETVILDKLEGLIFLETTEGLIANPSAYMGGRQLDVSKFPHLQDESFEMIANTFLGLPISAESLRRLQQVTRIHLRQLGHSFTLVFLPEQDITDGYIQVVLMESRFSGEIDVEGNRYFSDEQYQKWIRQADDGAIDAQALDKDIAWINRNPFRAASVVASPGSERGTTKLVIQAREIEPVRFFVGANNTGTQSTTEERALAGFNWGNAFGLGHQLTMQVTTDQGFEHSKSLSGSYTMDLPWRHSLNVSAAYSETDGIVAEPFNLEGKSSQLALGYTLPLTPAINDRLTQNLTFGFDFKSSDNNFDFADIPITDNVTEVVQLKAQYSGALSDKYGSTSGSLAITASPGGVTSRNEDEFFSLSRANASADYIYSTLNVNRRTPLSGPMDGWTWTARIKAQLASHNLIGSEQFGAGGSGSVRGYEEGEVFGDEGFLFSQELVAPPLQLAERLGLTMRDSLSLYVFQDYAQTRSVEKLPGEKNFKLHSLGLGFRYQLSQLLTAQAAWGFQLRDSGSSNTGDNDNLHVSVQVSF